MSGAAAANPGFRIAFFGGAFDPPHMSHVLAALWALETGEVDRVFVIPSGQHPFGKQPGAGFGDRMELCRLAFHRLGDAVEVLDIEGRREGITYTIDTLRDLAQQRPGATWRLLVGSDNIEASRKWRAWDEIVRIAPPLVVPRMTASAQAGAPETDLTALSSTWIRERLRARAHIPTGLVPHRVLDYIHTHGLYLTPAGSPTP